jgi:methyltransferase (TIGR00027 family)
MDAPRPATSEHWDLVAPLSVSSLYLTANQTYRGQCQLIFDPRHVARLDQLTRQEWVTFAADLFTAQQAVMRAVRPDHLNIESLGNVVPHLHWHIIPRYLGDPRWGAPVWQVPLDSMPDTRLPADEREALIAALRQALTGPVTSMSGVGLTARWVAANRALETDRPDPLYRDPYARELAGDAGFDMLYTMRALGGAPDAATPDPYLSIRTRFLDDGLLASVRDSAIAQVVILAAGMDARAFRLDWPKGTRLFEIDRDDVFRHKEPVLARLQAQAACDRRVVRQDLAQPWAEALIQSGFDPSQPSAFLAEGLLYYLDEPSVASMFDTLRRIAATGSWLGLDVITPDVLTTPFMRAYLNRLEQLGCPWKSGIADPDAFLAVHGWRSTNVLPGEPEAHYGRWPMPVLPRNVPGVPRMYLVRASRV